MPLEKYEDFLELSVKQVVDYLSVRGLNTSGKKVEFVARGFAAFELKMDTIASSVEQKAKLKSEYHEMVAIHDLADPLLIEDHKKIYDIKKWPALTLGNIFAYILQKKMCDKGYIGRYKDQKAYSYWDSGFVGPIFIFESNLKKAIMFLYSNVTASQTMSDTESLWSAVKRKDEDASQIICAWCSCMAGAYET